MIGCLIKKISYFFFRGLLLALCITLPAFAADNVIPAVKARSQKSAAAQQEARMQTTHISRQEIKESPVTNLAELLQREQSIVRLTNNSMDSGQTALSIRGFGDNAAANSLILVDGFPLANVSLLTPNFNSISLSDIERIDIIQGSQGSLWGNQAVGGVMNIITRHPEKLLANAQLSVGNMNQRFFNGYIADKFAYGFFIKAFGFTNQTDGYRDHNQTKNNSFFAQTGFDYARGTVRVNAQAAENTVQFPGSLTEEQFHFHPRRASEFKNFSHYQTQVFQLLNKHELNSKWMLETRLAHNVIMGDGWIAYGFNRKEWQDSINPQLVTSLWNAKTVLGYFGQRTEYHLATKFSQQKATAAQNDIYAQTIIPVWEKIDVTLGTRSAWQQNSVDGLIEVEGPIRSTNHVFVSEQGISYRPSREWQFFLRRDGNFRFPKANEETWLKPGENTLKPQTGVSYETGLVRKTDQQKTQFNLYHLQLQNEIAFDPTETPLEPMGRYNNFPTTLRRGATIAESYYMTRKLKLDSQLNFVDARFSSGLFSGKRIPTVPMFNANAGARYEFTENWRAKFSALYTGSRYASLDLANQHKKMSGYWLETVALQYMRPSYEVSFEVGNIFNANYAAFAVYNKMKHKNLYYPGTGRSYLLTFKASID